MTTIRAIACALPETEVTNADLDRENPAWQMDRVAELSGVHSRRFARPDETAFDLTVDACDRLFAEADLNPSAIDAIVYCTLDPDHPMPGNSQLLHGHLGLEDRVLCFDYSLACSGFVYGVGLADAVARAGLASEVLLVTAETQSKRTHPRDRSVRALLADGAAVTWLSAGEGPGGRVVACDLRTHGKAFEDLYIPAGGARRQSTEESRREVASASGNVRTAETIYMDGSRVMAWATATVPAYVEELLAGQSLRVGDVDLFVFHQASEMILDSLARTLRIPPEKMFRHMEGVGNLASASIPFALRAALDQGVLGSGDRVLLCGFGAGASYGSATVEY